MKKRFDVICIGAALVDMVAKVERHPLEDDEVFVSDLILLSGGAAANSAFACAKIGLKSAFLGKLGLNDIFGSKIIDDFKEVNVSTELLKYTKDHGTGSAYVALNQKGDRRIYAYSGAANYLSKEDILENELRLTKVIFLSSLKNLEPFIKAANIGKKNNIPIILNPGMLIVDQGFDNIKKILGLIDILILSQREFKTLLKIDQSGINESIVKNNASKLLELGIKVVIATLGEKGAVLITNEDSELITSTKVENVVDTTGAGDAFSAGFIYKFSKNPTIEFDHLIKCVKIGNFVAANCIQHLGARYGIPDLALVKNFEKILNNKI